MKLLRSVALRSVPAFGLTLLLQYGCRGAEHNGPTQPGSIQGTVVTTTGTPLAGLTVQLLNQDRTLRTHALTTANGSYEFLSLPAGEYFVRAPAVPGYAISPATDSLRAVAVTAGQTSAVSLALAPLTTVTHTVTAGSTDTAFLASQASAVVAVPSNGPRVVVSLADTIGVPMPPYYPAAGPSVRLSYLIIGSATDATAPHITVSIPVPSVRPSPSEEWALYAKFLEGDAEIAEGFVETRVTTGSALIQPSPPGISAQLGTVLAQFDFSAPPSPTNANSTISVARSRQNCLQDAVLTPDAADTNPLGGRKALVFIHGIQLPQLNCVGFDHFDPASETFKALVDHIRGDPKLATGYKLYFFKYPSWYSINDIGSVFAQALRDPALTTDLNSIVVVAHSMGGLVARQAMTDPVVEPAIERLITLATPHTGTPAADTTRIQAILNDATIGLRIQQCYERLTANLSWSWWKIFASRELHLHGNAGLYDLWSKSDLITKYPPPLPATKVIGHAGQIDLGSVNHGSGFKNTLTKDALLTIGCILETDDGVSQHDAVVPVSSAAPPGLATPDTFVGLDHIDMSGDAVTPPQGLFDRVIALLHQGIASALAKISGDNQSAPLNTPLQEPLVVRVTDGYGDGVRGIVVAFSLGQGGGSVTATATTDATGQAKATWIIGGVAGTQSVTASVNGLQGSPVTFTATASGPPTVATSAASAVTGTSATLNGSVTPGGKAAIAWFEWGTSPSLATFTATPGQSLPAGTTAVPISWSVSGLLANTTYYFRAAASNSGGTAKGDILSFNSPTAALTVAGSGAGGAGQVRSSPVGIDCTITSATTTGTCSATYGSGTVVTLNVTLWTGSTVTGWSWSGGSCFGTSCQVTMDQTRGVTLTLGGRAGDLNGDGLVDQVDLDELKAEWGRTDLPPGDVNRDGTVDSRDLGILLSNYTGPTATTAPATGVTGSGATLNGSANPNGRVTSAWFEWGTTPDPASFKATTTQAIGAGTADVGISAGLSELTPNTTYYFRASASGSGGIAKGNILNFITPRLPDLTVTASVASSYVSGQTNVAIPVTVTRSGGSLTQGTYVTARLYWSTDPQWDASDSQLWESNGTTPDYPNTTLNTTGSVTVTPSVAIPATAAGSYYVLAVVDPTNFHPESDETNNVTAYVVTLNAVIAGGTYLDRDRGLVGTVFLVDFAVVNGFPTIRGPAGWNGGNALTCGPNRPPGMAVNRAWCADTTVVPITGDYTAEVPVAGGSVTARFPIDASFTLAAPLITDLAVTPQQVRVQWTAAPQARSFLIRLTPIPDTGPITGQLLVSGGARSATLSGLSLVPGAKYRLVVYAFGKDVVTPGDMDGQFNVSAHGVTITVPTPATIVLQPSAMTVRTVSGVSPRDTFFTIRNGGDGSLNWTISSSVGWLSLNPTSGTTTTETDTVRVQFAVEALLGGTYPARIIVTDPSAPNSPQELSLTLRVGWRFAAGATEVFDASPAIGRDGTIYIASTDKVYAIGSDGAQTWSFPVGGDKFRGASAAIAGDTVLLGAQPGNNLYSLYVIDANQRSELCHYPLGGPSSSPAIGPGDTIYIASGNRLFAITPGCAEKWKITRGSSLDLGFHASPAIGVDATIYIGSAGTDSMYAIKPDGMQLWSRYLGAPVYSSAAIGSDGTIYVGAGKAMYALDPSNGEDRRPPILTNGAVNSSPALAADGTVYFGDNAGWVYTVPPGRPVISFQVSSGEIRSSPAIGDDGLAYFKSTLREVFAVGPDGVKQWSFGTEGASQSDIQSSPAIAAAGVIYVGSGSMLYAIPADAGGLAPSSWPKFRHDNQNTGRVSAMGFSSARTR